MNMAVSKEDCVEHLKLTAAGTKISATSTSEDGFAFAPGGVQQPMYTGRVSGNIITISSSAQDVPEAQAITWE